MRKSDLDYSYPSHLVATYKKARSRVMAVYGIIPMEISLSNLISRMKPDDLLVINDSKVIPARIYGEKKLEILFVENLGQKRWKVLCPAKQWPKNRSLEIPGNIKVQLIQKGRVQIVETSQILDQQYFEKYGDIPLPPYIQQARGERRSRSEDIQMYQSAWAKKPGSLAAPTASLHFSKEDIKKIKARGVLIKSLSLHVGPGTFLPIHSENLEDHKMHSEFVEIPENTWEAVKNCKKSGGKVWALGSTVTRALESMALSMFRKNKTYFFGYTDLFIKIPFEFKIVDVLMTNFHTPKSTLLAMVMAFAGTDNVKKNYQWAIERNFRLFSYGDLTLWEK